MRVYEIPSHQIALHFARKMKEVRMEYDGLTYNQENHLQSIFNDMETFWEKLTPWEQNFLNDLHTAYEKFQSSTRVTPRMWQILGDIEVKMSEG